MNWHTDPPNGWTGLYRLLVIAFLAYIAWANVNNPNVPELLPTLEDAVGSAVVGR